MTPAERAATRLAGTGDEVAVTPPPPSADTDAYDEAYAQALRALGLYVTPVDTTIAPTWTDTGGTS